MSQEKQPSRRTFLNACLGSMGAVAAGLVAAPFAAYLKPTVDLESEGSLKIEAATIREGEAVAKRFQRSTIFVLKTQGAIKVLSGECTHAGCIIMWDHNLGHFRCPCHGAEFSDVGKAIKGPARKPLKEIPFAMDKTGQSILIGETA